VHFETTVAPRGPYSLVRSAWAHSDPTRRLRDGVLTLAFEHEGAAHTARAWQRPDGPLEVRIDGPRARTALEPVRFMLAADDDHSAFLAEFRSDALLGPVLRRVRGLRPIRAATVTHALLKAVCGQLIQASEARRIEARLLRSAVPEHEGLRMPPTRSTFAGVAPASLARQGLAARKAATLVRLSRTFDLERLRGVPSPAAVRRIESERGLGPWSAGMISLYGLGRFDHGLVGDLGLVKLCSRLAGRWATADDTRELLAPYGEWSGLASVYLLAGGKT
jgi:DNA-3-methyladenine glycosylase II